MSSSSTSTSTTKFLQDFDKLDFQSRKILMYTSFDDGSPPPPPRTTTEPTEQFGAGANTFDTNVVMVLSVLLCALLCSIGLNSIIRCALRFSNFISSMNAQINDNSVRVANTGVKKKALRTFPTMNYSPDLNLPGLDAECIICLSELYAGERIRLMPKCNHGFHARCIDKWLSSHSSCPKCRQCLIETCHKIVGNGQQESTSTPPPPLPLPSQVQDSSVTIVPLEREGFICNYM